MKHRTARIGRVIALGAIVLALGGAAVFGMTQTTAFNLTTLDCRVNDRTCQPAEEKPWLVLLGQPVWQANPDSVIVRELSVHPEYQRIQWTRHWPSRIRIMITLRQALGTVSRSDSERWFFDEEGVIFPATDHERDGLSIIVGDDFPLASGIKSPELPSIASFHTSIRSRGWASDQWRLAGQNATAEINRTTVTFRLAENLSAQVASLHLILSRSKIEGKTVRSIDLRFDKPVVVFDP